MLQGQIKILKADGWNLIESLLSRGTLFVRINSIEIPVNNLESWKKQIRNEALENEDAY